MLKRAEKVIAKAERLRNQYNGEMLEHHSFSVEREQLLKRILKLYLKLEKQYNEHFAGGTVTNAKLTIAYIDLLQNIKSTYDDLFVPRKHFEYTDRLIQYDACRHKMQTEALLEYEYCSGALWSGAIIDLRYHLGLPENATAYYNRAVALTFNGQRVHYWPNEYHIPTLFKKGLRSQPYWDELPLKKAMEDNYHKLKEDFLRIQKSAEFEEDFTQNDHSLITKGTWGELKLFNKKEFNAKVCKLAPFTCEFIKSRPEIMGEFPTNVTHHVGLPREAVYFKMEPGTHLKPHTGPVNFHLYCHLGLQVPEGPKMRVGPGDPVRWEEGKALCFDDSYVHEAWHGGSDPRYVFMMTVFHPDLGTPDTSGKPLEETASARVMHVR